MIIYNSYSVYLIYSLLIITHFTGIYFSIWGTTKFLNWFKANKDKLLLVYAISFITISVLITLSLVYTLTELGNAPEKITPSNLKRTIHAISVNLSEIYPFYRISFFITFCSIWVLTAFLLYDYFGRNNRLKFWVVLSIPPDIFLDRVFSRYLKTFNKFISIKSISLFTFLYNTFYNYYFYRRHYG